MGNSGSYVLNPYNLLKCPAQILILIKQLRLHWVCSSKMGFLLPGRVHPLFLPENTFYTQNGTSP